MFRRSGSFVCFLVEGSLPEPRRPEFAAALAEQRFRDIQDAAEETVGIGWITPLDPSGETFEVDDMDHDAGTWLRLRMDKKALPPRWVAVYRSAAERSLGRPMNRRERQELLADLREKLLPRLLPAVNLIDALYHPPSRRILLFATGKGVREEFARLFHRTFEKAHLLPADPHYLARAARLRREEQAYLEEVAPVPWPRRGAPQRLSAAAPARERDDGGGDEHDGDAPIHDLPIGGDVQVEGEVGVGGET